MPEGTSSPDVVSTTFKLSAKIAGRVGVYATHPAITIRHTDHIGSCG